MSKRVFIVDDERLIVQIYSDMLISNGYEVVDAAYDGEDALKKFRSMKRKPDLIIMDHRMPIKNGIEVSEEMLRIDPSVKILFVSADSTVKNAALKMGAVGFLEKPFDMKEFFEVIESALSPEVPAADRPPEAEDASKTLLKEALKLGFEVGYHGHFERAGWVGSKRRELALAAQQKGMLDQVSRNYDRGKELGRRKRHGRFHIVHDLPKGAGEAQSAGGGGASAGGDRISAAQGTSTPYEGSSSSSSTQPMVAHVDLQTLSSTVRMMSDGAGKNAEIAGRLLESLIPVTDIGALGEGREMIHRGLQSLVRAGWADYYSLDEFDEQSGKVQIRLESLYAKAYGNSDKPVCSFIENFLSRLCSVALRREVALNERECISLGAAYCLFST